MLDKLFGISKGSTTMSELMYWQWANQHYTLFFLIEILQPTLVFIIFYVALKITQAVFKRN